MKKKVITALIAAVSCAGALVSSIPLAGVAENTAGAVSAESSVARVTIAEINGDMITVRPEEGSDLLRSSDKLNIPGALLSDDIVPAVGMMLEVTYTGGILEIYPAMFDTLLKVTVISDTGTALPANTDFVAGDVNNDGAFNVADVVILQKWLLGVPDTGLENWKAADLCNDERLDVFDLTLMKRDLIEKLKGSPELEDPEVREVLFGYPDSGTGAGAPMSSIRTALKCKAFCPSDKSLIVDVAMLGTYNPQGYEGSTFLYEYSIYPCENWQKTEDTRLIVNGEAGSWSKVYTGEERSIFNLGREYDDLSTYHHETAELVFSGYPAGSSGSVVFMLKHISLNEDGTMPEHPSTMGGGQMLYFYVGEEGIGISSTGVEDAEEAYKSMGVGDVTPPDTYTGRWHGKNISYELYEALKDPDGKTIPVMFSLKDDPASEDDFVYNGRTIKEYKQDTMSEDFTRMDNLLNSIYGGDQLKYGEEIYISGTPDGTKWTKEVYDLTVESYGEELLSKYIVDGEFLKEQLAADLSAMKLKYQAALSEAVEAFYTVRIEETIEMLREQGIRSERMKDSHDIVMYVTADEFDTLDIETASYYGVAFQKPTVL